MEEELKEKERIIKMLEFKISNLEDELKYKPSAIQIIAFGLSCFTLGVSIAKFMT